MAQVVFWVLAFLIAIVASFGIGYVINVSTRVWWLAMAAYIVLMGYLVIVRWISGLGPVGWFFMAVLGLGSVLSSVAIKTLKNKGYKMFPS